MNCEDVRELLPAYVVGLLDRDELEAVEEHIRLGREHDDELVELRATVFAMDRFGDELSLSAPASTAQAPALSPAGGVARARRFGWPSLRPAWGLAAAAVVILAVFGFGWLAASVTGESSRQDVLLHIQGARGEVVNLAGGSARNTVSVTMAGFERLPPDRAYQLWAIRDSQWLRIGVCNMNAEGGWKGEFPFTIRPGEQIALTVEPTGGSQSPTSEPILTSRS